MRQRIFDIVAVNVLEPLAHLSLPAAITWIPRSTCGFAGFNLFIKAGFLPGNCTANGAWLMGNA
jgi:hypothetical protein